MKQALVDLSILWVLLAAIALLMALSGAGVELPVLARTTLWRFQQQPLAAAGVALLVVAATLVLAAARRNPPLQLFVAGALGGLSLALYMAFDPGTAGAFAVTAGGLYRRLTRPGRRARA